VEELQFQNSWESVLPACYGGEAPGRIFRSPTWTEKYTGGIFARPEDQTQLSGSSLGTGTAEE
jgi:hypothetical protein